jgi:hypothetical protein
MLRIIFATLFLIAAIFGLALVLGEVVDWFRTIFYWMFP